MAGNPFKPTAGKMPPILIGREDIIADFSEGLANGAGAPGRLMLVAGQRGYGKTVLLTEFGRLASANGWLVVNDTAEAGLASRLITALARQGTRLSRANIEPRVSIGGVASASFGSITIEPELAPLTLRNAISERLKGMKPGKGILFTIDEAQSASRDDLVAIATAVQHTIRDEDLHPIPDDEKHGIAFAFAALPSVVDDLVNDKVLTFLRRAQRRVLGPVATVDVRHALQQTCAESGKELGDDDALIAAKETQGFPYMVQLVGYYLWQSAERRHATTISPADVARGIEDARMAFGDAVCAPLFRGLTAPQQNFLRAMLPDAPDASSVLELAKRCGKSASWGKKYRRSLEDSHVIEAAPGGGVVYAVPRFAEYLANAER